MSAQGTPYTIAAGHTTTVGRPQSTTSRGGKKTQSKKSIGFYKHTRDTLASLEASVAALSGLEISDAAKLKALSFRDSSGQENDNAEFTGLRNRFNNLEHMCKEQAAKIKALEDSAAK